MDEQLVLTVQPLRLSPDIQRSDTPGEVFVIKNIPERKLIEQTYGEDLSNAHVVVSEFKVPLTEETFEKRLAAKSLGTSGSTMYLGIMIDDNDTPGADRQKTLVWPGTYGAFAPETARAIVEFE